MFQTCKVLLETLLVSAVYPGHILEVAATYLSALFAGAWVIRPCYAPDLLYL